MVFLLLTAVPALWAPATCRPDQCFCEAIGSGAVAQPANAWSSLAFVLAGLWIAFARTASSSRDKYWNRMVSEPAYRRLYGCSLVAIGLGSYYYHASLSFAGQVWDMSGMYLLITFALLYGVARRTRIRTGVAMATYLVCNVALLGFQIALPDLRRYVFAVLVLGVLAIEATYRRSSGGTMERRWLSRAAGTLGLAFLIWVLDITKLVCSSDSALQGHALWHVLGAVAGWCLYRYYQSEAALREMGVTQHT